MNSNSFDVSDTIFSIFDAGINKLNNLCPAKRGSISDVVDLMNSPNLEELTKKLRSTVDEAEQKKFKANKLPFATFGGLFEQRRESGLIRYSGLMCFDVDHLSSNDEVKQVKSQLLNDPYFTTELQFTSPRGNGVKWITHIDLERASYKEWYEAISYYLLEEYGITVDPAPKNVVSACFLCHDPEVKFRQRGEVNNKNLQSFDLRRYLNLKQEKQTSVNTCGFDDTTDYQKICDLVDEVVRKGIDLTERYNDWMNLGFALKDALGEEGRPIFHKLSSLYPRYDCTECDKKYSSIMKGQGSGITISTLFHLAKEAGIDINVAKEENCAKSAKNAKVPNGTNRQKEVKNTNNATNISNGTMAQVAECTFSDRISREALPPYLWPVIDNQSTAVGRDKMLLGVLNMVSGILPPSIYGIYDRRTVYPPLFNILWGGYATSKGELEVVRHLAIPIKNEMRRIFDDKNAEYKEQIALWESQDKKTRGPQPKRPMLCTPFVAANSSAAAVYRTLDANNGWGIIFDTEADTLTNMLSKSEYGDFSDLLRKAHHHETISMTRVGDDISIEIESPRLAVMLTCTGSQLPLLLPANNVANGLASRFLFYGLPDNKVEFRNVFDGKDNPIENVYKAMGQEIMPLYHELLNRTENPIQFVLSDAQQKEFVQNFEAVLQEQFSMLGDGIQGFIYRMALECFRYAMVLTVLRRLSKRDGEESLFNDNERALACDERDFKTAFAIVNCLITHTGRVYSVIGSTNNDPFSSASKNPSRDIMRFYSALPDNVEFTTGEALSVAQTINISERTVHRMLGEMVTKYNILSHPRHGTYAKASASNNQEAASSLQTASSDPLNSMVNNPKKHSYEKVR